MKKILEVWGRFWFEPQRTRVLGLYRIVIGAITIYSFALWAKDVTVFFSDAGVLTAATLGQGMAREFHTILCWIRSPWGVKAVLAALFISAFLFTIGWKTRLNSILLFILVTSFHERNNLVLNSGDTVLRCMLFFFMFAPAGASFSIDSLIQKLRQPDVKSQSEGLHAPWAQRMMQVQVALIYFVTAYAKSRGQLWHGGEAMYYIWGLVDFHVHGVEQLMNFPLFYSTMTFISLFAEISLPYLLWFRASRPFAVLMGIALHGWMMLFMTLPVFPILMMAAYIPFYSEEELNEAIGRIQMRWSHAKARVFYDGLCPLCLRSRRVVELLDLFQRAQFVDVRQTEDKELPAGCERQGMLKEMHLVTSKAEILTGFFAFRWLSVRLPATACFVPLLYIPAVPWIGSRIYAWVARNRWIAIQCDDAKYCDVHQERG